MPGEIWGPDDGPGVTRHQTGHRNREARGPQALGLRLGHHLVYQGGEFRDHRLGGAAPVRGVPHHPRADLPAQVDRADREVVHAYLGAYPGRPPPTHGERGARPADPAGTLGTQLL